MMRPDQRPRTGTRRDGGVRVIRTDGIRYPGADHPLIDQIAQDESNSPRSGAGRLTARDTGLALQGRAARLERHKARARRRNIVIVIVLATALFSAALGWRYNSDKKAANLPLTAESAAGSVSATSGVTAVAAHRQFKSIGDVFRASETPKPPPTPIFAAYKGLKLRLPVPVDRLTEIGFHQASYPYALRMTSPLPDAKLSLAANRRGTSRDTSAQPTGADAVLVGTVLRMWRPRPGKPDTAADVGARPGTAVYAPVSGSVVKIKSYKLYGKWSDFEVHIRPDGFPSVDLVMIHVTDLKVKEGARVEAGVTQIASIRKLSDKVPEQIGEYMKGGGGDHVHLQLNNANDRRYKGLEDAIDLDAIDTTAPPETGN